MKYIMSFDSGTTSSRCMIFDKCGNLISVSQKEFTQYFPYPGWVEHDAVEIWNTAVETARTAMEKAGLKAEDIDSIGITNQRETTVLWDKTTGEPVSRAIVWQCRRTAKTAQELCEKGYSQIIREKTGLLPDAYFSATKIKWILDNVPGVREKAERGDIFFGTVDSWLLWNLTGGKVHVTDYTNASRTMIFNIHTLTWDKELLSILEIPEKILPEVKPSSYLFGKTEKALFGGEIPVSGIAGDQQSALFGQCCFVEGEMKNTYGTGCFLLMNTGKTPKMSENGLVTTIAAGTTEKVDYALEGSIFTGGAAVQWLRDELKTVDNVAETEELAMSVPDTEGAYVVPAFTGMGAPYWSQKARGTIVGVTRGFSEAHLARATLESLAYQTDDIIRAMEQDAGIKIKELNVDGGAARNNFLMQFQSDVSDVRVVRPSQTETTALGAAYLAGLASGFWKSTDEIKENRKTDKVFAPEMERKTAQRLTDGWHKAVKCALFWAEMQNF